MSSLVIVNTLRTAICYLYNLKKLLHYLMGSSWLSFVGQRSQLLCPTCRWENCGSEGSDSLPKGTQMLNSGREFCSPDFALRDFYLEETKEEKRYFFFFFFEMIYWGGASRVEVNPYTWQADFGLAMVCLWETAGCSALGGSCAPHRPSWEMVASALSGWAYHLGSSSPVLDLQSFYLAHESCHFWCPSVFKMKSTTPSFKKLL